MFTGKIFEIKRFAVHDGHGIRTTFFFKGCPLNCIWCHNPEGIAKEPEIAYLERKCVKCGECIDICPNGLHKIDETDLNKTNGSIMHITDRSLCNLCFACVNACIPEALKLYGKDYTAEELYEIALADIDFYIQSGGGITCSGGEPLMQADFLAVFLKMCKEAGLHTAVDTSGYAAWKEFDKILPFTDIFYYDIKHMNPTQHKTLTGVDNKLILENLQKLSDIGAAVEVRIPVVPGHNDDNLGINQTAEFLKSIKTLTLVRPLPYHALSGSKYTSLGIHHSMPVSSGDEHTSVRHVCEILEANCLPVKSQ